VKEASSWREKAENHLRTLPRSFALAAAMPTLCMSLREAPAHRRFSFYLHFLKF